MNVVMVTGLCECEFLVFGRSDDLSLKPLGFTEYRPGEIYELSAF